MSPIGHFNARMRRDCAVMGAPMPIRVLDILFALLLVGLGIHIVWMAIGYGYIVRNVPGPGFFPFWVGLGIVVFALLILMKALRLERGASREREGVAAFKIVAITAAISFMISLLPWLGMLIAMGLLIPVVGIIINGGLSAAFARRIIPAAFIAPIACYVIFGRFLNVPLITGVFGI